MKTTLIFVKETEKARLYRNSAGAQHWIPRSVIRNTLKHPHPDKGGDEIHELDIESWFARTKGLGE
jgi:gluconate kinase